MPAKLDVDWTAVRMLAVQVGLKEAAERLGLPYGTVRQRSAREHWMEGIPRNQAPPLTVAQPVTLVTSAPKAMGNILREMSERTRLGHARAAVKVAERVEGLEASELMEQMPAVLQSVKHAAVTHSWSAGSAVSPSVRLDVLAGAGAAVRLEIGPVSDDRSLDEDLDA